MQRININSSEFVPQDEYVLVRPFETQKEETTAGGIVLQVEETSLSRPAHGEIISIGANVTLVPSVGEAFWPETDGLDLKFDDGKFVLLRQKSIVGLKVLSAK